MKVQWPSKGDVEFSGATMRYRDGLEPSIRELSFRVEAGMKVGIVGRTGSGKSSILQTLFRLVELSNGKITIDGTDLSTIGLHQLRKQIAYIPQSPFLLQGTIRENLDPFNELTDSEIEQITKDISLYDKIQSLDDGINTYCSESNNLFSVGQK